MGWKSSIAVEEVGRDTNRTTDRHTDRGGDRSGDERRGISEFMFFT